MHVPPLEIPSPEPSSLVDFPHLVSQPGVLGSNFPTEHILPSLGCSSGTQPSGKPVASSAWLSWELERLGLCITPTVPRGRARGCCPNQGLGERAED